MAEVHKNLRRKKLSSDELSSLSDAPFVNENIST